MKQVPFFDVYAVKSILKKKNIITKYIMITDSRNVIKKPNTSNIQ